MNDDNDKMQSLHLKNDSKRSSYSIASFILSAAPITILILGFIFCFIVSGGEGSDNDRGAVWWIFIFLIGTVVPAAMITTILSIIFGIKGLKIKKTIFSWLGIIIASFEILTILLIPVIYDIIISG